MSEVIGAIIDKPSGGRYDRFISVLTDPARLRRFSVAGLLATWLPMLGAPFLSWWGFSCFYTAGLLAFGPGLLDIKTTVLLQHNLNLSILPFIYPPAFALLYVPLSALPYWLGGLVHLILMASAYLLALRLGARILKIPIRRALLAGLVWAPAGVSVATAQNDTFTLLLFVLGVGTISLSTPAYIGILYKPQLGIPVLGTIWLRRPRYGTLLLLVAGLFHYSLGVVATGGDFRWPATWLNTVLTTNGYDLAANGWQTMSISSALGHLMGGQFEVVGYVLAAILVLLALPVLRRADTQMALALALALAIVISPHSYVYDGVLLLPLMGIIWARSSGNKQIMAAMVLTYAAALVWVFPLWPIQPLLVAALAWIIYAIRTPHLRMAAPQVQETPPLFETTEPRSRPPKTHRNLPGGV